MLSLNNEKEKPLICGEPKHKPRVRSPFPSMVTTENLQLKNFRAISDKVNLPRKNVTVNSYIPSMLQSYDHQIEYSFSTRICQLMNELYYTPVISKNKIPIILAEIKKIKNPDIASSVFIAVFQNIKFYIKEIRNILLKKLRDLGLVDQEDRGNNSRRRSADYVNEARKNGKEIFLTLKNYRNHNDELRPFYGSEENYIEFLISIYEVYKSISEIFGNGPEIICHQLLSLCQSNSVVAEYDVHKSLFYDYVLKDRVISVRVY